MRNESLCCGWLRVKGLKAKRWMANMTELEMNTHFSRRLQDWGLLKKICGRMTGEEDEAGWELKTIQKKQTDSGKDPQPPPTNPSSPQKIKVDVRSQLNLLLTSHVRLTSLCSTDSVNPPVFFFILCQMSAVLTPVVFPALEWRYVLMTHVW